MREYWLRITPETHVRATDADKKSFFVFGPLTRNPNRSPKEEAQLQRLIEGYPAWYKRFLQLERYNDYKRRLTEEAILRGFWLRDYGMEITFYMPVSPSWREGKKEKFDRQPHQYKPDIDNLTKSLFDTLKPQQDCAIWHIRDQKKLWLNEPQGSIHIICHEEAPVKLTPYNNPQQLKLRFRYTPRKK